MDQFQDLLEEKCKHHPSYNSEFLLLEESSPGEKICFSCIQEKNISKMKVLSIKELLNSSKNTILSSYPPLNDINLKQLLSNLLEEDFQQKTLDQIDLFFTDLREQISLALDNKMTQTKQEAIQLLNAQQEILEQYQAIADIQTLKQLVLEQNNELLSQAIKQKIAESNQNTQILREILGNLKQVQSNYLIDRAKQQATSILKEIQNIHIFKGNELIFSLINFVPSKYKNSLQNLSVARIDNESLHISNIGQQNIEIVHGYFDFILDPMANYVIRAQIQQNSNNNDPWFYFGIQPEECKDQDLWKFKLGYCETGSNIYAVSEIVKGEKIQSGRVSNVRRSLEFRIQLNSKIFKVADYPYYSSVVQLDDQSRIDLKLRYRFIIGMGYPKDVITILDFFKVDQFDKKMD